MKSVTLFLLLSAICSTILCDSRLFTRVDLAQYNKDAVCNDGTSAIAAFRPGVDAGANKWVFYLEGGFQCWDQASCEFRKVFMPTLMTSHGWPETFGDDTKLPANANLGGVMNSEPKNNPNFYNWNQVYVWYCTSDMYLGNSTSTNGMWGWKFNGKILIQTLIQSFLKHKGLDQATDILWSGFSAGGFGAFSTADYVADMIKAVNAKTKFRALADSGCALDITPSNLVTNISTRAKEMVKNFNVKVDPNCAVHYPGEDWKCFFCEFAAPYIKTPVFYSQYTFDLVLYYNEIDPIIVAYLFKCHEYFMKEVVSVVESGFFPNCFAHGNAAYNDRLNVIPIQNVTLAAAVGNWFNAATPPPGKLIDTCSGIGCSPHCPPLV